MRWPAEDILEQHLANAQVLRPALEGVIARHLENRTPMILEVEDDERRLVQNFLGREPDEGEQDKRARVSWLYGQWLREEARCYDAAALSACPWATLPERLVAAANKPW